MDRYLTVVLKIEDADAYQGSAVSEVTEAITNFSYSILEQLFVSDKVDDCLAGIEFSKKEAVQLKKMIADSLKAENSNNSNSKKKV